jgi:hypothetical protein
VSARNLRDRDWVFAAFTEGDNRYGFAPYKSEIVAIPMIARQTVRHLVETHTVPNGYLTEPYSCPSSEGRRVIFTSNRWVKAGPIAAHVAECS